MNAENLAQDPLINAWQNLQGQRFKMEALLFHPSKEIASAARFFLVCENHVEMIMTMPPKDNDTIH